VKGKKIYPIGKGVGERDKGCWSEGRPRRVIKEATISTTLNAHQAATETFLKNSNGRAKRSRMLMAKPKGSDFGLKGTIIDVPKDTVAGGEQQYGWGCFEHARGGDCLHNEYQPQAQSQIDEWQNKKGQGQLITIYRSYCQRRR
jgi:hypothetical protein